MSTSTITKNTALATVLAAAAITSGASAAPIDPPLPGAHEGPSRPARTIEVPQTVTVASQSGFDWGDAGIGAAGTLSLLALGAGSVVVARRGRRAPAAS